ncbi:sulfotransferase [Emcibacter sp. SYSU 3D8]|uniref:sulfotransferase family protein n=1 Tax=Emcibacter sp. SYSU 3D8 TaxID=3133969 RepID=UPI0031FE4D8B
MHVNLFILGAMKGGTHAAHTVLDTHPAIAMSRFKEPVHFIDAETLSRVTRLPKEYQDEAAYMSLFDVTKDTRYLGESSTSYTLVPEVEGVADRIHSYNPDARLIYMVRDPLRRIISHFFHERRMGQHQRDFKEALAEDPRYVETSDYARQIAPYLACFPSENVRIVVSERFRDNTVDEAAGVFQWLGLDPAAARITATTHYKMPDLVGMPRNPLVRRLRNTALWKEGKNYVPRPVENLLRRVLYTGNVKPADVGVEDIIEDVRNRVAQNAKVFYDLLGGPVPEWRATNEAIARHAR